MSVYENTANAQSASGSRDEEYLLTEGEAQLATVLALMTGFSQGCCAMHRAPMARRVAEQLVRHQRKKNQLRTKKDVGKPIDPRMLGRDE